MNAQLDIGTRVRILKRRPGWIARVAHCSTPCGFYTVRLLTDADGHAVETERHDGPYCRNELKPLTEPPPGSPSPTTPSDKDVHFLAVGVA